MFLLSSTAAHSMFDDEEKLFFVHTSNVLSENSTKIAGSQFRTVENETLQIEPEGTNLRTRITLHHCLEEMVPGNKHGVEFYGVKLDFHLHKNKDVCAYLDPLTAFRGEIFGGVPSVL